MTLIAVHFEEYNYYSNVLWFILPFILLIKLNAHWLRMRMRLYILCNRLLIDAARIVCGAGLMKRSSLRPSVRLSHRSTAAAARSGFAAERIAGRRYRSIAGAQQQRRCSTAISSKCEQCTSIAEGWGWPLLLLLYVRLLVYQFIHYCLFVVILC